jgi:hypothetical protein
VAALPAGTIVAGAVKDDASGRLDGPAIRALRTLGVLGDLRGRFRASHAFVGLKGALPGSALEGLGPRHVTLAVGETRPEEFQGETPVGFELAAFVLQAGRRAGGDGGS